jgi:prephenate dehydratase
MPVHEKTIRPPHDRSDLSQPRVAYQGIPGAFGEEAIRRLWFDSALPIPSRTFTEVLDLLIDGVVDWAVIPIWNSTIGPVAPACAALRVHESAITRSREIDVPVNHCLLGLPGTLMTDVRFVGSHVAALGQCAKLFATHEALSPCEAFDTAGAARELSLLVDAASPATHDSCWYSSLGADPRQLAAIASADAGRRYGLSVLLDGVQDDPTNLTRFVVVRSKEARTW